MPAKRNVPRKGHAPIVVGSLLALSGPDKSFGITQQRGMQIALDEVNSSDGGINGKPLVIEFADSKLQEDLGLQEYKRLTGDKGVQVIVGITGSGVNLRLAPFAAKDKVVILRFSRHKPQTDRRGCDHSSSEISPAMLTLESFFPSGQWNGATSGQRSSTTPRTLGPAAWNRPAKMPTPRRAGHGVSTHLAVLDSTDNFGAAIVATRDAKPDAVFVCLMGRQSGMFVAQAKANHLDVPFYGTDPFSQQEFIDNAKEAGKQAFFVLPAEEKTSRYKAFEQEYRRRFSAEADSIAAKAYDAVHTLAAALRTADKQGPLTGDNICQALRQVSYDGITGPNTFDEHGDLKEPRFDRFTYKDKQRVRVHEC